MEPQVEIKNNKFYRIFSVIIAITCLILGIISGLLVWIGVFGFGGNGYLFLFPISLIISSFGLLNRKKWSLYLITACILLWYVFIMTYGNGFYLGEDLLTKIKSLIIFILPLVIGIYLWSGYKNLNRYE